MRTLSSAAAAALSSSVVPITLLIEMDLSDPLYLALLPVDIVWNGHTWLGAVTLGSMGAIEETPSEVPQLSFGLSGVHPEDIALALTEQVQGKAVKVYLAVFDPTSYALLDVRLRWQGELDVMTIVDGVPTATISVTAETAGIDFSRPGDSPYTDYEQQRLHPGDLAFQYLNDQVDQTIVWPAADFLKQ